MGHQHHEQYKLITKKNVTEFSEKSGNIKGKQESKWDYIDRRYDDGDIYMYQLGCINRNKN